MFEMTLPLFAVLMSAIVLPLLAVIVWAVRLEGRQNAHETECRVRTLLLDERHGVVLKQLDSIGAEVNKGLGLLMSMVSNRLLDRSVDHPMSSETR